MCSRRRMWTARILQSAKCCKLMSFNNFIEGAVILKLNKKCSSWDMADVLIALTRKSIRCHYVSEITSFKWSIPWISDKLQMADIGRWVFWSKSHRECTYCLQMTYRHRTRAWQSKRNSEYYNRIYFKSENVVRWGTDYHFFSIFLNECITCLNFFSS